MAEYLKKYVDRVADVPAHLHRLFALIRDLDSRASKLQDEVEDKCRQQLAVAAARAEAPLTKRQRTTAAAQEQEAALAAEIEAGMQKLVSLSEEKIKIACQVYDYVDNHIRLLDEDLRQFDDDISQDKAAAGIRDEAANKPKGGKQGGGSQRDKRRHTRKRGGSSTGGGPAFDAPPLPGQFDDSEPRYCVCKNVSYGEMILCDNKDCAIEWFHVGCVKVQMPVKGKWYCSPECEAHAKATVQ